MVHAPSSYLLELGPAFHDIKLHYDFCVKAGFCRGEGKLPHLTHLYHYLRVHQFAFPHYSSLSELNHSPHQPLPTAQFPGWLELQSDLPGRAGPQATLLTALYHLLRKECQPPSEAAVQWISCNSLSQVIVHLSSLSATETDMVTDHSL